MKNQTINAVYLVNIIFQAFFNMAFSIGVAFLISWLITARLGAPSWVYAPIMLLGVFFGIFSMVRFIITATDGLERMNAAKADARRKEAEKQAKRKRLSATDDGDGQREG